MININTILIGVILILLVYILVYILLKTTFVTIWKEKFLPKKVTSKDVEKRIDLLVSSEILLRKEIDLYKKGEVILKSGMWCWDMTKDPDEVSYTDNFAAIFSVSAGQLVTAKSLIEVVHHDDRSIVNNKLKEAFDNKQPYAIEYRVVRRNGMNDLIVARGEPILNLNGKTEKIIGTVTLLESNVK